VPALPSWLTTSLWDQFAALLPARPTFDPGHPLGCHRRRVPDWIVFDKLLQVLRFGCSYQGIADTTCSTLYERREQVIDAFFDLADAIITVRSLIRKAWTLYRWDSRPARRP
jgi:hypothetical protein